MTKDTKFIQNKKPYLCQMRCLIKSLERASKGKWTANYLGGNFHTFAEVNAYLKIHYKGNAPELVPFEVGSFFMRLKLWYLLSQLPKKHFIIELYYKESPKSTRCSSHAICCYKHRGYIFYYDPQFNKSYPIDFLNYKIKGIWSLEHKLPITPPLAK